jgi:hypothetical protein
MPEPIHAAALAILRSTPITLRSLVAGVPDETLLAPMDNGWSVRDVIAHLVDTNSGVIVARMRRIVEEDHPYIHSIDAPARLEAGDYRSRTVASLLDELAQKRDQELTWVLAQPLEALERTGEHDEAGEISALDQVYQWAWHDLDHLKQAVEMLKHPMPPHMGNTRRFYDS